MEYQRTQDGQIQADVARRIGRIVKQYENFSKGLTFEERYEATLYLSLLQLLLTNCMESLKIRLGNRALREFSKRTLDQDPTLLGFQRASVIEKWPSSRPLKYEELLSSIRNAMSHPCPQVENGFPQTGYTSWQSDSGFIEGFIFTHSPWGDPKQSTLGPQYVVNVNDNCGKERLIGIMKRFQRKYDIPELSVRKNGKGGVQIFYQDRPFVPVLRIKLDVDQLKMLTMSLSEIISEPVRRAEAQKNQLFN